MPWRMRQRRDTGSRARAAREASGPHLLSWRMPILLSVWLPAKQLLWSPSYQPGAPHAWAPVAASTAVALLVIGLAARFRGRAQPLAFFALDVALTGLYQVHLLYHRQFFELASVADLTFAWQVKGVGSATRALFRTRDALLWLDVVALAYATFRGARALPVRRGLANALVLAGGLLFAAPALAILDRPLTGPRRLGLARAEVAARLNVVGYEVFDVVTFVRQHLDVGSRGSAGDWLRAAVAYHHERALPSGPLTGTERGRDVIVVQLESLQRFAAGRIVGGVPVTPHLDALARESIAFSRAFTQVGQGTTSDAELLAGCSLYPLRTGAVFTDRYDVHYRCLPEVLRESGYRTVAMHANWPNFWNRDRMYPAIGFDEFLSIRDFDRAPVVGYGLSDARFFEQAAERLMHTPEPFYAMLVTLSNHAPFYDPNVPQTLPLGPLRGTYVGDYLDSVHFADAALGTFIDRLRTTGLLERSVLVVYGDHGGVSRTASGTEWLDLPVRRADVWFQHELRVPLLVRLPGGRNAQLRDDAAGEVDIAPTVADLLGVRAQDTFFHGRSLVSDPPRPVVFPDGSAVTDELVLLGPEAKWGPPACVAVSGGMVLPGERCDALADHAARELAVSRAEVHHDLFRWMTATR